MTRVGLVIANLFRRKARTTLTALSVVCAFLLFGLLQSVNVLLKADRAVSFVGVTRLLTQARVSLLQPLPIRLLPQIEAVPGVEAVAPVLWFGGQTPENTPMAALASDPERLRAVSPQWVMPEAQWQAFARARTGLIAGRLLADKYHWKVGDHVPIRSVIYAQHNGRMDWDFEVVGIFDGRDADAQRQTLRAYLNRVYVDEGNQLGSGNAGFFVVRIRDPGQASEIARSIDALFENSPDETRTQTEKEFVVGFIKQVGDIALIVRWILFAVFFTLLLVVGNTMAQSVRERIPELAVLKTLGFSDGSVLGFVLAESVAMCAIGGFLGLGIATLFGAMIEKGSGGQFQLNVGGYVWAIGIAAIALMSLAVGLLPALRAQRLKIVDALAGR